MERFSSHGAKLGIFFRITKYYTAFFLKRDGNSKLMLTFAAQNAAKLLTLGNSNSFDCPRLIAALPSKRQMRTEWTYRNY